MSPTPGARRPCPRAYAPWLLSLAATLLLAVGPSPRVRPLSAGRSEAQTSVRGARAKAQRHGQGGDLAASGLPGTDPAT
ncbi:hypothetical protein GUL14_14795 [Pseudomonas aeruginosa]|nr:hypothetical protein [Pseudomonas aeruginosa]